MTRPMENDYDMLVYALVLAVAAPTEEKAQACADMAEGIASRLSPREVERAQRLAGSCLDIISPERGER